MDIIKKIEGNLAVFKGLFDDIRIIDPLRKEVVFSKGNKKEEENHKCFAMWKTNVFCKNCVSMRAYINNDTFIKIEYEGDKVFLVTAVPIEVDGNIVIAELLKDITRNGSISYRIDKDCCCKEELIDLMNEIDIRDKLTGVFNKKYISERLPVDLNYCRINGLHLSIIIAEVDIFEKINDDYSRNISNKALIDFSNLVMRSIRSTTDWVGTYTEKKFLIVLNETQLRDAYTIAEKIRDNFENTFLCNDNTSVSITTNFGVYSVTDFDSDCSELLSELDRNLCNIKIDEGNSTIINLIKINGADSINIRNKDVKLKKLQQEINEMRETLDEICCTIDEDSSKSRRLAVSQFLDELIVEYMKEANGLRQGEKTK